MNKTDVFSLIVVVLSLVVLSCLMKQDSEHFEASRAYQNNVQPFYLSPQAMDLWIQPAMELCKERVAAQCANLPIESRIGCVQKNLYMCEMMNRNKVSAVCSAKIPETICKRHCSTNRGSAACKNCINVVQAKGVCSTPQLQPY